MEAITPAHVQDHNPPHQQEASGWSIFWPLALMVLQCMTQVSFTGYLWNGGMFEDSLWPHRSSPFVCLVDAAADVWMAIQTFRASPPPTRRVNIGSIKSASWMKLSLYFSTVLTPAIIMFGMRGIPVTQTITAIFCLASTTNLLRILFVEDPQEDIVKLVDHLKDPDSASLFLIKEAVTFLGWAVHLVCVCFLFYGISDKVGLDPPENVVNGALCVITIWLGIYLLYILQYTAFMLLGMQPRIPHYPLLIIFGMTNFFCLPVIVGPPGKKIRTSSNRLQFTIEASVSLSLCSYFVAYAFCYATRGLHNRWETTSTPNSMSHGPASDTAKWLRESKNSGRRDHTSAEKDVPGTIADDAEASNLLPPHARYVDDVEETTSTVTKSRHPVSPDHNHDLYPSTERPSISTPPEIDSHMEETAPSSSEGEVPSDSQSTDCESTETDTIDALSDLGILGIAVQALELLVRLMKYAGLIPSEQTEEAAAEHDTAGLPKPPHSLPEPPSRGAVQSVRDISHITLHRLDLTCRFLVRWTITLTYRLLRTWTSLWWHTCDYIKHNHDPKVLVIAFAIANFTLMVIYYLCLFEKMKPGWETGWVQCVCRSEDGAVLGIAKEEMSQVCRQVCEKIRDAWASDGWNGGPVSFRLSLPNHPGD